MSISVEQKFKVGDRVRVVRATRTFTEEHVGHSGEVIGLRGLGILVRLDNALPGSPQRYWHAAEGLELITDPHPTPRTITLDGVTYTLTPVQEQAEEVKREPKQGEVWAGLYNPFHYLILTNGKLTPIQEGAGIPAAIGTIEEVAYKGIRFAYPTLRAAFEAGAL